MKYKNPIIYTKLYYSIPSLGGGGGDSSNLTQSEVNPRITQIIESIMNTNSFKTALTHKSFLKSNSTMKSYENLEFLGDSLLHVYLSMFLYNSYPNYTEGRLVEERGLLESNNNLAKISLKIGLYKYLKADKKMSFTDPLITKVDHKILADIYESFLGALYIERGSKLLSEFICLTILDGPEYINRLPNFEDELPEIYNLNVVVWVKNLEKSIIPILEKENIEYEYKAKLIMLIDKSLSTHNNINEFLNQNNVIISQLLKQLFASQSTDLSHRSDQSELKDK